MAKTIRGGVSLLLLCFLFAACDVAFMDRLYDEQESSASTSGGSSNDEGSTQESSSVTLADGSVEGTFEYLNATSYTSWVYVDLASGVATTADVDYVQQIYYDGSGDEAVYEYIDSVHVASVPESWTLAIHRYDVKTNGCGALATDYSEISEFRAAVEAGEWNDLSADMFTADVSSMIIFDMSGMMSSRIGYVESGLNAVLCSWMTVDTSNMPPDYSTSDKVYLLLEGDGTVSALRFTGYSNPYYYDTKGYISFDYVYGIIVLD